MVCVGTKVFQGMGEFSQNMKKKKITQDPVSYSGQNIWSFTRTHVATRRMKRKHAIVLRIFFAGRTCNASVLKIYLVVWLSVKTIYIA